MQRREARVQRLWFAASESACQRHGDRWRVLVARSSSALHAELDVTVSPFQRPGVRVLFRPERLDQFGYKAAR